jgi:hypothetical protein
MYELIGTGTMRRVFFSFAVFLFLNGCDVENVSNLEPVESGDALDAKQFQDVQISGVIGDGLQAGASVQLISSSGAVVATSQSDESARYHFDVKLQASDFPLVLKGSGGENVARSSISDFELSAVVATPGKVHTANINSSSTIARLAASEMSGGISAENVDAAFSATYFSLNTAASAFAPGDLALLDINNMTIAEYLRSSVVFGEALARTEESLNQSGGAVNRESLLAALASDLSDSALDGAGGVDADPRTSALMFIATTLASVEAVTRYLIVDDANAMEGIDLAISRLYPQGSVPEVEDLVASDIFLQHLHSTAQAAERAALASGVGLPDFTLMGIGEGMLPGEMAEVLGSEHIAALEMAMTLVASGDVRLAAQVNEVSGAALDSATNSPAGSSKASSSTLAVGNKPPSIVGTPSSTATVDVKYKFIPTSTDPNGDTLTFTITNKPSWATFGKTTGKLVGIPTSGNVGKYSDIQIQVSDGKSTASLPKFSITVSAKSGGTSSGGSGGTSGSGNVAPTISGSPATSIAVNAFYKFLPVASDPNGDVLTFSIANKPGWASFGRKAGKLTGTPSSGDVGTYSNIVITVSDGKASKSLPAFSITVGGTGTPPPATGNKPPVISGKPNTVVTQGTLYNFQPTASDPEGKPLTFSISGLPSWASFSSSTGRLWGTPSAGHVGTYSNIKISVSDGSSSAALATFSIRVDAYSSGSVTLSWSPPTRNTDGTVLTDLSGYKIEWGNSSGAFTNSKTINNAGLSSYVVENLASGSYKFVVRAINKAGLVSGPSNVATKTVP